MISSIFLILLKTVLLKLWCDYNKILMCVLKKILVHNPRFSITRSLRGSMTVRSCMVGPRIFLKPMCLLLRKPLLKSCVALALRCRTRLLWSRRPCTWPRTSKVNFGRQKLSLNWPLRAGMLGVIWLEVQGAELPCRSIALPRPRELHNSYCSYPKIRKISGSSSLLEFVLVFTAFLSFCHGSSSFDHSYG